MCSKKPRVLPVAFYYLNYFQETVKLIAFGALTLPSCVFVALITRVYVPASEIVNVFTLVLAIVSPVAVLMIV